MEHEMKISAALVRRLRTARGWSQDQLAMASGLSLRTIQRIEAEGVASMATKVSLAATFDMPLGELSADAAGDANGLAVVSAALQLTRLMLGLAVLSCVCVLNSVLMVESTRSPVSPLADGRLALLLLLASTGMLLAAPAAFRLLRARRVAGVALAILGMPLAVLLACGLLVAALRGHAPNWPLLALGIGGIALVAMAVRDTARPLRG
jgi:transcriptional regulator with XRE-family HTH domain